VKPTARRILALFKGDPGLLGTPQDILRALRVKASQERLVRAALEHLAAEGALVARRGQYALPDQAAAPKPATQRGTAKAAGRQPAPLEGMFSAHADGYGFVAVGALKQSLFIPPPEIGGALDGDWVRVEEVPARGRHRTAARVVEVLERRRTRARGHVVREGRELWVSPLNERLPDVLIRKPPAEPLAPDALVDVEITHFPEEPRDYPEGRILGTVAGGDSPAQIIENILANTSLYLGFSKETHAEMAALGRGMPAAVGERVDLTRLPFVTIDPVDARDMDDALCIEPLSGGGPRDGAVRLWVAIADVAAYVRPGSAVDGDGYRKGTSVYFPSRVLPMLPEELSGDLCSLRPQEERPAMVCEMEIGPDGITRAYTLHEAVIRSRAKLNYGQVLRFFETGEAEGIASDLLPVLGGLREVARRLREMREKRGSLSFVFPEARFELGADGMPIRINKGLPSEATRLVEQCMVEANEVVARHCAENRLPVLYRVHDRPPGDALENLAVHLWNAGIESKPGALETPEGINAALRKIEAHPAREQLELMVLKSMSQAVYRDSNDGHFALAATHYCHFTSPIRRYPDLIVHRALKAWLAAHAGRKAQDAPRKAPPLPREAGGHLSAYERIAADTESQVARLYRVLYMEPRVGEDFAAKVTGLNERGLIVSLRDEFVDGFLPLDALHDDFYRFEPRRNVLEGRRHRRKVGLGTLVTVTLTRADRLTQQLEFAFGAWGVAATPGRPPAAPAPPPVLQPVFSPPGKPHRRRSDAPGPIRDIPA
jgi:ribonuclease R